MTHPLLMDTHTGRLVRLKDIPLETRRYYAYLAARAEDDPETRLLIRLAAEVPGDASTLLHDDDHPFAA